MMTWTVDVTCVRVCEKKERDKKRAIEGEKDSSNNIMNSRIFQVKS